MKAVGPEKDFVRLRQCEAPLRKEREQYRSHLREQGTSEKHARVIASRLLHINRLLGLVTPREIHQWELEVATQAWVSEIEVHPSRTVGISTAYTFRNTAEKWLRFHNMLVAPTAPAQSFEGILSE